MTQNSNKINFWRGTRFVFERKIQRNELIVGTVYFVGNSMEDVEGTGQSTYGVIYQAVSENRAVRYGIFATDDDITRLIEELTEKIDEEGEERREADDQLSERIAHLIPEVADAVENHMAIFDSDGRLKDSGRDIVEFLMDGDIDDATIKFENGKLVVQDYSHKHHISDVDGLRGELDTKIGTEKMGTSNGIATLDENAKVNLEQMPYTDGYGIDITSAGEIKTEPISDAEIDAMNAGESNGHLLDNLGLVKLWNRIVSFFVQKEEGKGLSSNDYTDAEKNKLAGIESGAEVNVQSDWNQTNTSADDFIRNKPSVYTKTEIDQMLAAGMHYEVVSSLPSTGEAGTLYLVPSSTSATGDVYDEYIWLPTEGQVSAHFEKIGTTKADLANYYTKSEVDTALGNKQASITITNNTTDPTDNDTIIMQANGVSNTTTFLRRKLSYLWNWIQGKADIRYWRDSVYRVNMSNFMDYGHKILSTVFDNELYAADKRYTVTWNTYDSETDELIANNQSLVGTLFTAEGGQASRTHPKDGEYDIIEISNGTTRLISDSNQTGVLILRQYYTSSPLEIPTVEILNGSSYANATWSTITGETLNNEQREWIANYNAVYMYKFNVSRIYRIKITVKGKTTTYSYGSFGGAITSIYYLDVRRPSVENMSAVTKYAFKQALYGDVEAPSFIMRGGTNKQVLLANGTVATLPLSIANGGTGATTAANAEYNLITKPRTTRLTTLIDDNKRIPFCNENPNTSAGTFAGYRYASQLWDYIKSKADLVYSTITETNKKTNRIIDHTWNQPSYSASASGTHVKICDIPSDCVCVMNVRKSVYGYPSINTLWIGNNNSLDFKSLTETDIVATVSSRICTLSVPAHTASGTPLHTYDFEISVLNKENLSSITWYDDATYYSPSRPTKPNIVMQQSAPVTDGSLAFNVNSSTHVASVSVDGYTDFVGMLTEDSTSAVLVKLSDEAEGSVYRFTFDHAIEGGVSFSNSNASTVYCEVSQDIHAGDTITLTAVSNISDGWIASVSSAGIISSDNSVNIEWENGVADLKVALDFLKNIAEHKSSIAVNGIAPTSQNCIQIAGMNNSTTKAYQNGSIAIGNATFARANYGIAIGNFAQAGLEATAFYNDCIAIGYDAQATGNCSMAIGIASRANSQYSIAIGRTAKSGTNYGIAIGCGADCKFAYNLAIGYNASVESGNYGMAIGYYAKSYTGSIVIGSGSGTSATNSNSVVIGNSAQCAGTSSVVIGKGSILTSGQNAVVLGSDITTSATKCITIGYTARTKEEKSIAIGEDASSYYANSVAIGESTYVGRGVTPNENEYAENTYVDCVRFSVDGYATEVLSFYVQQSGTYNISVGIGGTFSSVELSAGDWVVAVPVSASNIQNVSQTTLFIDGKQKNKNTITQKSVTIVSALFVIKSGNNDANYYNASSSIRILYSESKSGTHSNAIAIGAGARSMNNESIVIGKNVQSCRAGQIVIGRYWYPNDDLFIVANGSDATNRKNILTIDSNERVHARAYISDAVTYELNGDNVALGTITMGLLKVTGGGTLTLTSTNAVEGHCVKVYASGDDITCNGDTITAGRWREYLFIDGAWRSKM